MSHLVPIIAIISTFGTVGFTTYFFLMTRNRERMALIENGADASIFRQENGPYANLKWGMFLVAIGLALFIGHFVEENTSMDDGAGYFPLIFMFGGIALLLYYQIAKKHLRNTQLI